MIGSYPVSSLAPLEYRCALDAAMAALAGTGAPLVRCDAPELDGEVRQRLPHSHATRQMAQAALWVEPPAGAWPAALRALAAMLPRGGVLAIVASQPLAGLLPDLRTWSSRPAGTQPGGIGRLRRALSRAGFGIEAHHGFHTAAAIGLNVLSRQCERWGRPDLGDRLHFAARLHYQVTGPLAAFSTVALLVARKERD